MNWSDLKLPQREGERRRCPIFATLGPIKAFGESEATAVNMFTTSLPKQSIAREGEAPAEPLHRWLGRSLALPKVLTGLGFAMMFTGLASPSQVTNWLINLVENMFKRLGEFDSEAFLPLKSRTGKFLRVFERYQGTLSP